MLTLITCITAVLTSIILGATAMLTTNMIPLSSAKGDYKPPAISWIKSTPNAIGDHWLGFNITATIVSMITGLLVALTSVYGTNIPSNPSDPDLAVCFLAIITACTLGFHLVWSSCLDWRFHKIPRWALVSHMGLQLTTTVACLVLTTNYKWLITGVIIASVMCWLMGLPRSSGMSDGRLYTIVAAATIPFMLTSIWIPVLIVGLCAVINAIIATITGGASTHAELNTNEKLIVRILQAKSPMGPFVSVTFYVFYLLTIFQLIPTGFITL